jgi:hypothetical protein
MSERDAILADLRAARPTAGAPPMDYGVLAEKRWEPAERLARLRTAMTGAHTEFLAAGATDWPGVVLDFVRQEGLPNLLYGPGTREGAALAQAWPAQGPRLVPYDQPVEGF